MAGYSILFYMTHVATIVVVANLVFWVKDVDSRFKDGEDANFNDFEGLRKHKERLASMGKVRADLKGDFIS